MNIEQLKYFEEIAKTGSVSIAADRLHISQPAMSLSLMKLEKELGVQLFNRSRKGLVMTEEGTILLDKVVNSLKSIEEIYRVAEMQKSRIKSKIAISCNTLFLPFLTNNIEYLIQEDKDIQFAILEKGTEEIIADLNSKKADIGFLIFEQELIDENLFDFKILIQPKMFVGVNKNSPLAEKDYLTPEDVSGQKVILYEGSLKKWFSNYFAEKGGEISFFTNKTELVEKAVSDGYAIGFYSSLNKNNISKNRNIKMIPLVVNGTQLTIQLGWIKLKSKQLSKSLLNFLERIEENVTHLNGEVPMISSK